MVLATRSRRRGFRLGRLDYIAFHHLIRAARTSNVHPSIHPLRLSLLNYDCECNRYSLASLEQLEWKPSFYSIRRAMLAQLARRELARLSV